MAKVVQSFFFPRLHSQAPRSDRDSCLVKGSQIRQGPLNCGGSDAKCEMNELEREGACMF